MDSTEVRLVTLTGPGGSGKSRLAGELSRRALDAFPDGVYFVPLAAVTTAEAMRRAIADALGIAGETEVQAALAAHLAHRETLLVLDNLEQLADADAAVPRCWPRRLR